MFSLSTYWSLNSSGMNKYFKMSLVLAFNVTIWQYFLIAQDLMKIPRGNYTLAPRRRTY
jgi:hypothetical protein